MAQQSEQAPAESEPEEQPAASQPAGTAPETAASTEKMAEIKAKPAESGETMAAQEESASQVEQMKSYPQRRMGPNMARVSASIVDVEKTGNSYICTLKIEQILGTGMCVAVGYIALSAHRVAEGEHAVADESEQREQHDEPWIERLEVSTALGCWRGLAALEQDHR